MSLPYERDANIFAYEMVKKVSGDTHLLQELYDFWVPKTHMPYKELKQLFRQIDEATKAFVSI